MVLAKPQFPYTVIDKFLPQMTVLLLSAAPRYCALLQYMFIIFFFIFTKKFSAGAQNNVGAIGASAASFASE